jgi:hypothetical protein
MRPKRLAVLAAVIGACVAAPGQAQTPKPDRAALAATGILERLAERTGVYGVPPTAKTPGFIADAGWPQKLPNNWIIGQVGGLYVAPDDHIWIYQRPRTLCPIGHRRVATQMTMTKSDNRIFEYACHENSYAMTGILRGARAEERKQQ